MYKKMAFFLAFILLSGCTRNEIKHNLLHPNKSSNNPVEAAIYLGAALVIKGVEEDCTSGHPEDRKKCREAQPKSRN